jgi:prepilin-type N-terminal cleavage/methylation domain-containing protein
VTGIVRARIRRAREDGGFTLIEMMVAISLGLVVLAGATTMMLTTQRFARGSATRNSNTLDAGISVQTIARYLGSTTAICGVQGTANENTCANKVTSTDKQKGEILAGSNYKDLTFFSNLGDTESLDSTAQTSGVGSITVAYRAPYKVHIWVSSTGDLRADVYTGSPAAGSSAVCCTWPASPTRSQLLAKYVKVVAPSASSPGVPFSYWADPVGVSTQISTTAAPNLAAVTTAVGSTVDRVDLDVIVARPGNPVVPPTESKDSVMLPNRGHDQIEWKTFP